MRYCWSFLLLFSLFSCSDDFFPNEPGALIICSAGNLQVEVGDCSEDGTYLLEVDFNAANPASDSFNLFQRGNELINLYALKELPLKIEKFQPSGQAEDYLKVCIKGDAACCTEIDFMPPPCITGATTDSTCAISALEVKVDTCTSDSTYVLEIAFETTTTDDDFFNLSIRDNEVIDSFKVADLPIRLDSFLTSGSENDFIQVCIKDTPDCCLELEFMPPDCIE